MVAAVVPTDAALRWLCAREHPACFACRPVAQGGLGLNFGVRADGSVAACWTCPPGGESYSGIVHGGLLATALDSAMVHALFARGIVARTAELNIRYRHPARANEVLEVRAWLRHSFGLLHELEADICHIGVVRARARAKFMACNPEDRIASDSAHAAAILDTLTCQ